MWSDLKDDELHTVLRKTLKWCWRLGILSDFESDESTNDVEADDFEMSINSGLTAVELETNWNKIEMMLKTYLKSYRNKFKIYIETSLKWRSEDDSEVICKQEVPAFRLVARTPPVFQRVFQTPLQETGACRRRQRARATRRYQWGNSSVICARAAPGAIDQHGQFISANFEVVANGVAKYLPKAVGTLLRFDFQPPLDLWSFGFQS